MRPGGGKAKGAEFERDACRRLSLWVSQGVNEDCFWRSAMSGGRSTVAFANGKRLAAQAGDISAIHPLGHKLTDIFLVECKSYADLQITSILTGRGKLLEFWLDTKTDAQCYERLPMLIAKQNKFPTVTCFGSKGVELLGLKKQQILVAPKPDLRLVLLDQFLKHAVLP